MAIRVMAYDKVISAQNYVQLVTGKCFIMNDADQTEQIERILTTEGYGNLWNYSLNDLDEVLLHHCEDGTRYVLVEVVNINDQYEQEKIYRLYELPFDHDVTDKDFE
jgi:hypothetical protein